MKLENWEHHGWAEFLGQFKMMPAANNKIELYGKVVDNNAIPLKSVLVNVTIDGKEIELKKAVETGDFLGDDRTVALETDENGRFTISGEKAR